MSTSTLSGPTPESLAVLTEVVSRVARRNRLRHGDAQDFAQSVHLRLLERNYDVLSKFSGGSSLKTFLTTVVQRMLLDWRSSAYGRWRPSAAARRLGREAILLEGLIYRDGQSATTAIEMLRSGGCRSTSEALHDVLRQLPVRIRPRLVCEDVLESMADPRGCDWAHVHEADLARQRIRTALAKALLQLPLEDRRLLVLRYVNGQSVQKVARCAQVDPRVLYRRFEKLLRQLRSHIRDHSLRAS